MYYSTYRTGRDCRVGLHPAGKGKDAFRRLMATSFYISHLYMHFYTLADKKVWPQQCKISPIHRVQIVMILFTGYFKQSELNEVTLVRYYCTQWFSSFGKKRFSPQLFLINSVSFLANFAI